nr:uncharacterized protein LOC111417835 [Onthophagus taurus]
MNYSLEEYTDMHLVFGEARCSGRRAARLYANRYPNRRHPDANVFVRLDSRLRTEGRLIAHRGEGRPQRGVRDHERILEEVEENPTMSTRKLSTVLDIPKTTINRVLRSNNIHPYHYSAVQELHPGDAEMRLEFCHELLRRHYADGEFLSKILWTDESMFTRAGCFNRHNLHHYADQNPHVTQVKCFQRRWKINIWAGIIGNNIITYELNPSLNGQQYATFLQDVLPEFLNALPDNERPSFFQQDGAPPHNIRRVTAWLNQTYPGQWFGQYGPIRWPPRSPDLTPLDFFFWGYLKQEVYQQESEDVEDVIAKFHAATVLITPTMLENVRQDIVTRAHKCIANNGLHFEQQ